MTKVRWLSLTQAVSIRLACFDMTSLINGNPDRVVSAMGAWSVANFTLCYMTLHDRGPEVTRFTQTCPVVRRIDHPIFSVLDWN